MREGIIVEVSAADRARLEAVVADRNSPQKHVWRARIVLLTAAGHGTVEIMRQAGVSKVAAWRWQERFMVAGVEGLLRDKTRPSRIPPLGAEVAARVMTLTTTGEPPGETTHWTAAAIAAAVGISASSVQRIWRAHGLQPHRVRTFKLSNDPQFAEKVRAIVGLYVDPPAHAIVLSVDEKSQIQALDRTHHSPQADDPPAEQRQPPDCRGPGLPIKKGRLATMTHDYQRNGTTTLFAALNVLDGSVIGQCMQRHRHQEFIRFLNRIERDVPAGKLIHVILDNYATHKHPKVRAWLERHERWTFHYTPTSVSPRRALPCVPAAPDRSRCDRWLNAVEGFFAKLTNRRLKRGVFTSIVELQAAINRFVAETNQQPKPFVWTADPGKIIAAVRRGHQTLDLIH